jgi:hypothetical protein
MLSIEEIKLLIEKLEKLRKHDFQQLIDSNLKILKELEEAIDTKNQNEIDRLDKTINWYRMDLEQKIEAPIVPEWLRRIIQQKIYQFGKNSAHYNSLEIGPGSGMFSKDFRAWKLNYFTDILGEVEAKQIRTKFPKAHQKYLKFEITKGAEVDNIPSLSCNFVFSWDTFVFFSQDHIQQYLHALQRILIPGGYVFIQYSDCHYDYDLKQAERGYWAYNSKSVMEKIIRNCGYEVVEMHQFVAGANYAIFRKPGKQNPAVYKVSEITLD